MFQALTRPGRSKIDPAFAFPRRQNPSRAEEVELWLSDDRAEAERTGSRFILINGRSLLTVSYSIGAQYVWLVSLIVVFSGSIESWNFLRKSTSRHRR